MPVPRTIRTAKLGKRELRLVQKGGVSHGLLDGKTCIEGGDMEDVWTRLHHEAGKSDPRYFGYAGARAGFLKFFPDGFGADGFAGQERDYKVRAKTRLDAVVPLDRALIEKGLGEPALASSAPQTCFRRSSFRICCADRQRMPSCMRGRASPWNRRTRPSAGVTGS